MCVITMGAKRIYGGCKVSPFSFVPLFKYLLLGKVKGNHINVISSRELLENTVDHHTLCLLNILKHHNILKTYNLLRIE